MKVYEKKAEELSTIKVQLREVTEERNIYSD